MELLNRAQLFAHTKLIENGLLRAELKNIYSVLGGHIYFQTLVAAIRFDLFTRLEDHPKQSREDIAKMLGIEMQPCRILLLGLVTTGLIDKRGDQYSIGTIAKTLFSKHSERYIGNIVLWQHFINYRSMFHFYESLKSNKNLGICEFQGHETTLYARLAHNPELEMIFQKAMEEISNQSIKHFTKYVDLSDVRCLVDVGGGSGNNLIAIAKANPKLSGMVFDSSTVCEIAKENIHQQGLSNRLHAVPGDCFQTPFPKEADAILFCHFFTIWSPEHDQQLIKKAFESLPNGGKMILFNMAQWDSEDGPMSAAMGSPYFLTLATGEGMLYTKKEYMDWMKAGGFAHVESIDLPQNHVAIIGTKKT